MGEHFAVRSCVSVDPVMGVKPTALAAPCGPYARRNFTGGFTKLMILQRGERGVFFTHAKIEAIQKRPGYALKIMCAAMRGLVASTLCLIKIPTFAGIGGNDQ